MHGCFAHPALALKNGHERGLTLKEPFWKVRSMAQFGDLQVNGADPRVPITLAVPVALVHAFGGAFPEFCVAQCIRIRAHQLFREYLHQLSS